MQPQEVAEYTLNHGDILLSRSGTVGRSFIYQRTAHGPCAFAGYLVRFVPKTYQLGHIHLFTKTAAFEGFIRTAAISSTIENVNAEKYANCHVPLPPPAEQAAIVAYIDQKTDHIDALSERAATAIERLNEHRAALINAAVTGKIDVRESGTAEEPTE